MTKLQCSSVGAGRRVVERARARAIRVRCAPRACALFSPSQHTYACTRSARNTIIVGTARDEAWPVGEETWSPNPSVAALPLLH